MRLGKVVSDRCFFVIFQLFPYVLVYGSVVKHANPVVFIEGTGGCCDLYAKCFHLYNKSKSQLELQEQPSSIQTKEQMKARMCKVLNLVDDEMAETSCTGTPHDGTNYFEIIYECVEKRNQYLNFLDFNQVLNTGDDLVGASILQAFLKSNRNRSVFDLTCSLQ